MLRNEIPVSLDDTVRAGNILIHRIPNTVEPEVNNRINILYEDDHLLAIDKPAPLPVHPSGRFNKNTLISMLKHVWPGNEFYIVHRLDKDTTGVIVFAKNREAVKKLRNQFDARTVEKTYLALVSPIPNIQNGYCNLPISRVPGRGGSREVQYDGFAAHTEFEVLQEFPDNTALLSIRPTSGRTNQIRLHLQVLGSPIVGDTTYNDPKNGDEQRICDQSHLCLHAHSISFDHPACNQKISISTKEPEWAEKEMRCPSLV